jgi:hypothetical protein
MPDKSSRAAGQVFEPYRPHKTLHVSGTAPEDKGAGHTPGGNQRAGHAFKTGVGARAPRRVRFPSASAAEEASDQPLQKEAGIGRPRKGLDRSSGDRVYHTSLPVFASRGTAQVFRPPAGRPDKSSAAVLSKEGRKRHGPTHWTTHGEEDRQAGGSARGVPGALRGLQPQRQNRGVVRGPHAAFHGLVHFAGDHSPFRSSLDRPRAVRAGLPSPGLRAQHGPWVRAGP